MADRGWETVTEPGNEDPDGDAIIARAREMVDAYIEQVVHQAEERGLTADQVLEQFNENHDWFDLIVDAFYDRVSERAPGFVEEVNEYHRGFNERLRGRYGEALDGFLAFINVCVESGTGVYSRGSGNIDATGEVLLDLHARGCLVAHEIHTLLSNGYPFGALASWRTVHELQVIAAVLGEHGRENESNLTKRWQACDAVIRYRDAEIYQARVERLDYEPLDEELLARLERESHEALAAYPTIDPQNENSWAAEVLAPRSASFYWLEDLAGRGHLRGHYRWASHRVHADSRGNAHNWMTRGNPQVRLAGPTNVGLVDPADLTMLSMWNLTNSVLIRARDDNQPEPEEVVMMMTLERFYQRVSQDFVDADARVHDAERELQKKDQLDAEGPT